LKQIEETREKVEEIVALISISEEMVEHIDEMLACRPPAKVYDLYLKEKWHKSHIECCVS
jgi:hypothetical protein